MYHLFCFYRHNLKTSDLDISHLKMINKLILIYPQLCILFYLVFLLLLFCFLKEIFHPEIKTVITSPCFCCFVFCFLLCFDFCFDLLCLFFLFSFLLCYFVFVFALLCFVLLCFLFCFALLCFALLFVLFCFALLCKGIVHSKTYARHRGHFTHGVKHDLSI